MGNDKKRDNGMTTYNSIAEFNQALLNAKIALPAMSLPLIRVAQTELAGEIRGRVSVTGETNTGGIFSPYSEKHKKRKEKYGQTMLGKKTDKKNFYFSGKMWQSFGITRISIQGNRIVSNIGFLGQSGYTPTADLNTYHSDREVSLGNTPIAFPNVTEENLFVKNVETAVFQVLQKIL